MVDRSHAEGFFSAMEYEINQEKAAVLGKYGRRAEAAIERCQALLEDANTGDAARVTAYKKARSEAIEALDKLCMQREILGVYDNERVYALYRVPPPIA